MPFLYHDPTQNHSNKYTNMVPTNLPELEDGLEWSFTKKPPSNFPIRVEFIDNGEERVLNSPAEFPPGRLFTITEFRVKSTPLPESKSPSPQHLSAPSRPALPPKGRVRK